MASHIFTISLSHNLTHKYSACIPELCVFCHVCASVRVCVCTSVLSHIFATVFWNMLLLISTRLFEAIACELVANRQLRGRNTRGTE